MRTIRPRRSTWSARRAHATTTTATPSEASPAAHDSRERSSPSTRRRPPRRPASRCAASHRDRHERLELLERLLADELACPEVLDRGERLGVLARREDLGGGHRPDPGEGLELRAGGAVEVDGRGCPGPGASPACVPVFATGAPVAVTSSRRRDPDLVAVARGPRRGSASRSRVGVDPRSVTRPPRRPGRRPATRLAAGRRRVARLPRRSRRPRRRGRSPRPTHRAIRTRAERDAPMPAVHDDRPPASEPTAITKATTASTTSPADGDDRRGRGPTADRPRVDACSRRPWSDRPASPVSMERHGADGRVQGSSPPRRDRLGRAVVRNRARRPATLGALPTRTRRRAEPYGAVAYLRLIGGRPTRRYHALPPGGQTDLGCNVDASAASFTERLERIWTIERDGPRRDEARHGTRAQATAGPCRRQLHTTIARPSGDRVRAFVGTARAEQQSVDLDVERSHRPTASRRRGPASTAGRRPERPAGPGPRPGSRRGSVSMTLPP